MHSIKLSVIVVTYNCEAFLQKFVDELTCSLKDFSDVELLFIDNNSTDKTIAILNEYPQLKITASSVNLGFAKANNVLIRQAQYNNILLVNPDVFGFTKNFWLQLFQEWDHLNPLVIKLKNEDGSFQDCVGQVTSIKRMLNSVFKKVDYGKITTTTEVEMGIMAFMLITTECFQAVGLICEDYPIYAEDMDWCYRACKKGYKIRYHPALSLTHIGGGSAITRWKGNESLKVKYKAERIFIKKHYKGLYRSSMLLVNSIKLLKEL